MVDEDNNNENMQEKSDVNGNDGEVTADDGQHATANGNLASEELHDCPFPVAGINKDNQGKSYQVDYSSPTEE